MKKIAFIIALLGILSLLLIINTLEPKITEIKDLSNKHLNKQVRIQGITSNIKIHENNFTTFTLNNKGQIQIICNCPNILNNHNLEILGKVTKYKNRLQIEADKIVI